MGYAVPSRRAWMTRRLRAENLGWQVVRVRYAPLAGAPGSASGVGEMTSMDDGVTISWPGMPLGSPVNAPVVRSPSTR